MRGNLLHIESFSHLVAVEYIVRETGEFDNGGLVDWEGTFVPDLPVRLNGSYFGLELEDGRRGRIEVTVRHQAPDSPEAPTMYRFKGRYGV